ncbi:MAG: DUF423 domain-containing protein [Planctomycetota bacterium]
MMSARACLVVGAILGFLAVAMGAFGAHGLKDAGADGKGVLERKYGDMEPKNVAGQMFPASYKYLKDFETGVEYHMLHAVAMLCTGVLMLHQKSKWLSAAAWCFLSGVIFFSGALYILVIGGPKWIGIPWGAIAPIGGTLQLAGWILLAMGGCQVARWKSELTQ